MLRVTLIDEDGVYDPANFNDRLRLGLKGAMSEAELHVLKARLREGLLNEARRGEYRCILPTGFVYDEVGNVALDPDAQVRETLAYFFEIFSRVGSAHQTVKVFRDEGLRFPSRHSSDAEKVVFRPLTASTAMRTLNNPRYAGVYAYGRRRYRHAAEGQKIERRPQSSDWIACLPNAHPGYITWDQYQENLRVLESNGRGYDLARGSPPREGSALLQGRAVCGMCGQNFRVRYKYKVPRGRLESWYVCDQHRAERLLIHALADTQLPSVTRDQLEPGIRLSGLVAHQSEAGRSPMVASLGRSPSLPTGPQLVLPPIELTLPQPPLAAKGSNRHPTPRRLADRPLPISCRPHVTLPAAAHPDLRLGLIHECSAHVVSQINCQGIIRQGLQPRKVGSPDGYEFATMRMVPPQQIARSFASGKRS